MYNLVHLWSIVTQHPAPRPSVIPDNHGSSPRLHRTPTPLTVHYPYSNYQIIRLSPMQPSSVSTTRSFGYPRCSHPVLSLSTNNPYSSYPCTTIRGETRSVDESLLKHTSRLLLHSSRLSDWTYISVHGQWAHYLPNGLWLHALITLVVVKVANPLGKCQCYVRCQRQSRRVSCGGLERIN